MWLFAMFDLPVDSKRARREYTQFRKILIKLGFQMLQFSVYARYLPSEEAAAVHKKNVRAALPDGGQVRLLAVTDHQFGKMDIFQGKKRVDVEPGPQQLMLL